eukprot:gb/GFBE01055712.1/.p1 GENE.gb/GFBE01055712.1/~~gb/GFBE01055712.1/.p1  ORF type:complete len:244 (+),score=60.12 gb/GFBE01055712.1/:1-732(+)
MLSRMRGTDLMPLANLKVAAQDEKAEGGPSQQTFQAASFEPAGGDCWAKPRLPEKSVAPWVLCKTQPLRELLLFFARTHHNVIPVVEDDGGMLGILSRRDLLSYLDLAMQSASRQTQDAKEAPESISFDVTAPVEAVMKAMRRFRPSIAPEEAPSGQAPQASESDQAKFLGASLVYDKELSVKSLVLRVLSAENRKVVFVQDAGAGKAPKLRQILSAGDVWRLLIGTEQEASEFQEDLVAQDI